MYTRVNEHSQYYLIVFRGISCFIWNFAPLKLNVSLINEEKSSFKKILFESSENSGWNSPGDKRVEVVTEISISITVRESLEPTF